MGEEKLPADGLAPVFVLIDDDREASQKITAVLPGDWLFVPVAQPSVAIGYARHFAPTAILLAEPLDYPRGGAARLLQELLDEVGKPVIILTEDWSPDVAAHWQRMGASNCIPHPTRSLRRMDVLRESLKCAIAAWDPGGAIAASLTHQAARDQGEMK